MTWKKLGPDYHRLKTMVKRSVEHNIFEIRSLGSEMEIFKETPWSRIREQNSVYKEFLEIVGNGKLTDSVQKETIAVSVTISISVQSRHSQILLPILSCSRMRERRREPEVTEARVPVVECLDGPARTTSKELAPIHSVKNDILQNACSTSPRVVADLEKCSYAHRHVDEQPCKRFKKNGGKSAVCMLKKHELYDRTVRPVVYDHSSNTRQFGAYSRIWSRRVFIDFKEEFRHMETDPMCKIHESRCTSR